jgi:hypothetical protein
LLKVFIFSICSLERLKPINSVIVLMLIISRGIKITRKGKKTSIYEISDL